MSEHFKRERDKGAGLLHQYVPIVVGNQYNNRSGLQELALEYLEVIREAGSPEEEAPKAFAAAHPQMYALHGRYMEQIWWGCENYEVEGGSRDC